MAGRLNFLSKGKKITDDQWVLSMLKEGLKLEFLSIPLFSAIKVISVNAQNLSILLQEVEQLLEKQCNRTSSQTGNSEWFLLNIFFLVPKKSRELRPVINLCRKQVSQVAFKNRLSEQCTITSSARRLGNFSGYERSIFAHTTFQRSHSIFPLLHSRESVSTHMPIFWTHNGTSGFHKNSVSDCSPSQNAKYGSGSIHRPLGLGKSNQENAVSGEKWL